MEVEEPVVERDEEEADADEVEGEDAGEADEAVKFVEDEEFGHCPPEADMAWLLKVCWDDNTGSSYGIRTECDASLGRSPMICMNGWLLSRSRMSPRRSARYVATKSEIDDPIPFIQTWGR